MAYAARGRPQTRGMLMVRMGMDTEVVAGIGRQLTVQSQRLGLVLASVENLQRQAGGVWEGADLDRFQHEWAGGFRAQLKAAVDAIAAMGQTAITNAQEQVQASGGPGSGLGGVSGGSSPGTIPGQRDTSAGDLLALARLGYDGAKGNPPAGWEKVGDAELRRLGIDPKHLNQSSGLDAKLFRAPDGHYVLSFGGSQDAADWANNLAGARGTSTQQLQAIQLALAVENALGRDGDALEFTGHSLGGGLASLASLATGNKAITFNAAGVSTESVIRALDDGKPLGWRDSAGVTAESLLSGIPGVGALMSHVRDGMLRDALAPHQIIAYHVDGDILTMIQSNPALDTLANPQSAIGDQRTIRDDSTWDPISKHGGDALERGLTSAD